MCSVKRFINMFQKSRIRYESLTKECWRSEGSLRGLFFVVGMRSSHTLSSYDLSSHFLCLFLYSFIFYFSFSSSFSFSLPFFTFSNPLHRTLSAFTHIRLVFSLSSFSVLSSFFSVLLFVLILLIISLSVFYLFLIAKADCHDKWHFFRLGCVISGFNTCNT